MVYLIPMYLHSWGHPGQAGALLARPDDISDLDLTLRTVQLHLVLLWFRKPGRGIDEERSALGLSVLGLLEQLGPAVSASIVLLFLLFHLRGCWSFGKLK